MSKKLCSILLALGLLLPTAVPAFAASGSVSVTLPGFAVTLNGTEIDNDYSQYPLIVYKDITYFPMTYYDCRFLGLETGWVNAETGLFIDTTGIQGAYHPYTQTSKNAKSAKAQIASFPITVNGQAIDNSKEEYPLLLFRDVTYFPLTWRFCVDEFSWKYSFSTADGLVISSNYGAVKSYGTLPKQSADNNIVATDGKYVYYAADEGVIMSAPLNDLSQAKASYQMPINYEFSNNAYCTPYLYEQDGIVYLTYHIGGNTTGSNQLYTFNDKGEAVNLEAANAKFFVFGNAQFKYFSGVFPEANNLFMLDNSGSWQKIGSADYAYGWRWIADANGGGRGEKTNCAYYDGSKYLYIPAFSFNQALPAAETTGIYRVDVTNNETVRISPEEIEVAVFTKDQNYLYYQYDGNICQYNLTTAETKNIYKYNKYNRLIDSLTVLNGNIYLQTSGCGAGGSSLTELIKISPFGQAETIDEAEFLTDFAVKGDYLMVLCREMSFISSTPYRLIVIDKMGEIIFKSADTTNIDSTYVVNDTLYYYNTSTKEICSVTLNS